MAAPSRIKLIDPLKVWGAMTAIGAVLLVSGGFGIYSIAETENQKLIDSQLNALTNSNSRELVSGDYRGFVENLGTEANRIRVEILDDHNSLSVGPRVEVEHCASKSVVAFQNRATKFVNIKMCRPFQFPRNEMLAMGLAFAFVMIISIVLSREWERRSLSSLKAFFQDFGIAVDAKEGLFGMLGKIRAIKKELDDAIEREVESVKVRAIGDLAVCVAHDIRAPLAAIRQMEGHAKYELSDQKEIVIDAIGRIQGIADELLDTWCQEPRNQDDETNERGDEIEILSVVKKIENEMKVRFPNIQYVIRGACTTLPVKESDFERVIANLMTNGSEAIGGIGKVAVSIEESDDNSIKIRVSDDGKGIPKSIVEKITDRGFTFDKGSGTGLGLHFVSKCIRKWNASMNVESAVGLGTTITLIFGH